MSRIGVSVLSRARSWWPIVLLAAFAAPMFWQPAATALESAVQEAERAPEAFQFFSPFSDPRFSGIEQLSLLMVLAVAVASLFYAYGLYRQVNRAPTGTPKMQEVAAAIREGANSYLAAQFRRIAPLIALITVLLALTYTGHEQAFRWGRAGAFLVGALFSWTVGFVGMRLATTGNLRVAAAAVNSYGEAMQLGYRTGTVTGMLTDGLGLLGGTVIFLIYGVQAYEALLGFGFGGTLLALFMRVGGGIYTKAADVGADLVGKIEKDIPEDDPRNAATIADNVGDNVGDCAGMAADIFESYEVTIVAAMILGMASFGHKGVIFPLLVRGIGVLGSIISTYTREGRPRRHVGHGPQDACTAASGSARSSASSASSPWPSSTCGSTPPTSPATRWPRPASRAATRRRCPFWANVGVAGLDLRPALTCLIGVFLAVALNKVTSYYTHTAHAPVKSLTKACTTGHATNIIEGIAVGYESTVAAIVVIGGAILLSVLCYAGTPPMFIAYGVAMTGIGMLTLTGNTISMDVFGPVADNANGIGEMGYDPEAMEAERPAATSARARSWPTSTRWATRRRPRPRASPSARPSSRPSRSSRASSPSSPSAARTGSA